ncbi:YdcF family protein [Aureimonas populi]|uniref:YdcF family protein n=1 Tax=Aureimonas populi TaxID=1701758 RepID=A0ABW5CHD3_9HYPH|nr:YdcF family protein [Aureimonas populi]
MRQKSDRKGRGRRLAARLLGVALIVALALSAYLAGGFLRFAQEVASLSVPASLEETDGIVVLTGGAQRIERALDLLKRGEGQRLLISGVNPGTGIASLSRLTGNDRSLFECCVDLDYAALDTIGNARMTARWAREHGLDRLILVTSDYHIPRSLIELEGVADAPVVVPYPVSPEKLWRADGTPTRLGLRLLATEFAKVLAAKARLATGIDYARSSHRQLAAHDPAS